MRACRRRASVHVAITGLVVLVAVAGCGDDDGPAPGADAGRVDGAVARADGGLDGGGGGDGDGGGGIDAGRPTCMPRTPPTGGFHVTPAGTAGGDGSMASPWDLRTALAGPSAVVAGSTIWVHGGTYAGTFSASLSGTAEGPIVVRAWPGDRVTLDGAGDGAAVLSVDGEYARYWGLEITNTDTGNRETTMTGSSPPDIVRGGGVNINRGTDVRFINLVVHDTAQGISFWRDAVDSEIYGCLVSLNGWDAPDRPHGHAIYTQNLTGTKRIHDNVLFFGFSYGVHAYTEGGSIQGFDFVGNALFQTGTGTAGPREGGSDFLIGGLQPAGRINVQDNFGWSRERDRTVLRIGYSVDNLDVTVRDNYVVGRTNFGAPWMSIAMTGNTFVGAVDGDVMTSMYPDNAYLTTDPTEPAVFVRPNRYEPGRANVIVYNWSRAASVDFDPSAALTVGARYEIRDVQDFFGAPVATGTYTGGTISLPMSDRAPAQPVGIPDGIEASERSEPDFGVFVLLTLDCA